MKTIFFLVVFLCGAAFGADRKLEQAKSTMVLDYTLSQPIIGTPQIIHVYAPNGLQILTIDMKKRQVLNVRGEEMHSLRVWRASLKKVVKK